jgi:CRISPR-associated DxTHG motif protein
MGQEHVLVSSVGLGSYDQTTYVLDGVGRSETNLSPVALGELLDIDRAFIARTAQAAKEYDDALHEKLGAAGVTVDFHDIPKIEDADDVDAVLDLFTSTLSGGESQRVSLDITHAYRSLPMVFFASLTYLDALGEVDIDGIYYGEYVKDADESPLLDITYLYTLMEWYYGLQSFERTGSLRTVATLLEEKKIELFERGKHPAEFATLTKRVTGTNQYLDSGLPIEAGLAARDAIEAIDSVDDTEFVGPEGAVLGPLEDALKPFALQQNVDSEADVELDMAELRRQADIVLFYAEKNSYWIALECARELFINRVIYGGKQHHRRNWLDKGTRKRLKRQKLTDDNESRADEETPELLKLWDRLGTYRNYYAHAGFDANRSAPRVEDIEEALKTLCDAIDNDECWGELE